jgi:23S rRNA (cytidine2498-2'-O)-methyltransferase
VAARGVIAACYLAPEGLESVLGEELARAGVTIEAWHGRLALSPDPPVASAWALDVWTRPVVHSVASVREAADVLRGMQRNWQSYGEGLHRRMALITAKLPPVKARALVFPQAAPDSHLGAWTLLAPDMLLASPAKTSPFVNGVCRFEEDHIGPPSRAYLKLWEVLTRLGAHPVAGERCVDLGASPGGWTWVIAALGAEVLAVDRSPLAERVAGMAGVRFREGNAFTLAPEPVDWLFSDVIAYPERMLALVAGWIAAGAAGRIVCTIKFQGATDHATAAAFAAIPGGRVMHLYHNKHELTFVWQRKLAFGNESFGES